MSQLAAAIIVAFFLFLTGSPPGPVAGASLASAQLPAQWSQEDSLALQGRFGIVGVVHAARGEMLGAPYYRYVLQPGPKPSSYVRLVSLRNGMASGDVTPEQIAEVPDNSYWLVGNEPNAYSTSGQQISPEAYAELTHRWYTHLKGLNPTAKVFVGQTAYADLDYFERWWQAYSAEYGQPQFDGYAIHANTQPPGSEYGPYYAYTVPNNVDLMREWMKGKGLQDRELWLTEYGVPDGRDGAGNIEWDKIKAYMRQTNEWLIANTDKVQRWFWFGDDTTVPDWDGEEDACWTGNLYHVNETAECFANGVNDESWTPLADEYFGVIDDLAASDHSGTLPAIWKDYQGQTTPVRIVNTGGETALVTLVYRDAGGKPVSSDMEFVAAGQTWTVSPADNIFLPDGFIGSATVISPESWLATVEGLPGPPKLVGSSLLFPETGHSLSGPFLTYWLQRGGLFQFGFPITDEIAENGRTVQYLERAVFEYWPENAVPYKVQLRLLGRLATAGRDVETPFKPLGVFPGVADRWYLPETSHSLSYGFLWYWLEHGGLDIFGFPISEEFTETSPTDGRAYTVQYFERARFEYHPENKGTPYEVLLGLLGSEHYRTTRGQP